MRTRVAASLLVAEALLTVHPLLAVAGLQLGGELLGKAARSARQPDVVVQAVGHLLAPTLVMLLVLAAVRVAQGSRGWTATALVLQLPVLGVALLPALRPLLTLAQLPSGWLVTAALAGLTVAGLLAVLLDRPASGPRPGARVVPVTAAALGVTVLGLAVAGAASPALPGYPLARALSPGSGDGRAAPLATAGGPQNPRLAPNPFNSLHADAWASDVMAVPGPRDPRGAAVESLFTGGDCATITFTRRGRLVSLCSSLRRVTAVVVDPTSLQVLVRQTVGRRAGGLTDFSGGGYFFLDRDDRIVFATQDGVLRALAVEDDGAAVRLRDDLSVPVASTLRPEERVTSVLLDELGRYWYVGGLGTVGVVDPRQGSSARPLAVNLGGEAIENSFAVDGRTPYVVTDAALYRLAAADGPPRVLWRVPYDRGSRVKPGQTSQGSGTTPTVLDRGRFVAVTDNAEPRMNVVVVGSDGRVACRAPVFQPGRSATENSLIGFGTSVVAENNDGYAPPLLATVGGATTTPGLARVEVTPAGCRTAWEDGSLSIPSAVSKASAPDGVVYTYSKPRSRWGVDAWYFTAVDASDGRVLWTRLAGGGMAYNNHYAGVALSPDGDLFVGTVNGLAVLRSSR